MTQATCSVDGCTRPLRCKGMCKQHYERTRLYGAPDPFTCIDCGAVVHKRDSRCQSCCTKHWREAQRSLSCVVDGCDAPRRGVYGLCDMHATRRRRHGSPDVPPLRVRGVRRTDDSRKAGWRTWSRAERERIETKVAYWGGRCWICGGEWAHLDHVKPMSRGGANLVANLRPACAPCNQSKSDRWPFPTDQVNARLALCAA